MAIANDSAQVNTGTGPLIATHTPTGAGKEFQTPIPCNKDGSIFGDAPTFWFVADRIVPAANKYILDVFNTSATIVVRVRRIWIPNWQVAAVVGVFAEGELRRITARTSGTSITPFLNDTTEAVPAGVTGSAASTAVTDSTLLSRWGTWTEEGITNTQIPSTMKLQNWFDETLVYEQGLSGQAPIILRQNQGIALKQITNTAIGTISAIIECTAAAE